jgi:hypothetical protein
MVLCASPAYLKKHGKPRHPSELAAHPVLAYSLRATGDQWDFEGPDGKVSVTVKPVMRTNSGDTCIAAARQGKGVILQPSFMVNADLLDGALVELMPSYHSIEFGIFAVYSTRRYVAPKVRDALAMTKSEGVPVQGPCAVAGRIRCARHGNRSLHSVQPGPLGLEFFHQRVGLAAFCEVGFVPNRQDRGHHRAGVLTDFCEIQAVEVADQLDEVHVQVNRIRLAAAQLEISESVTLGQFEGQ